MTCFLTNAQIYFLFIFINKIPEFIAGITPKKNKRTEMVLLITDTISQTFFIGTH